MTFIKDLHEGDRLQQVLFVREKKQAVQKNGKNYYALKLQDKTGNVDGKIWDLNNSIEHFEQGDYIVADFEVTVYMQQNQLRITKVRKARETEYDIEDFVPSSELPADVMYRQLMDIKNQIQNPYIKKLVDSFFEEDAAFIKEFKKHSAAKSVHHGFVGGLLQHTLRVTEMCVFFAKQYPMLNKDLLVAAAMFHDIGKIRELSPFPENDYTDEGQLIGHIVIGYEMLKDRIATIEGFPKKLETELLHCILSHHGHLEFGSPKLPSLLEAVALSYADDTDAKMEIMIEEFSQTNSNDFLGVNRLLATNIRKTSKPEN